MKSVLHFDIKSNGFLSALPYLMMWIVANVSSWIADYYRHNRETSVTTIRKTCNSVGTFVPGLALICAAYTGCNAVSTVIFLTIAVGSNGATYSGFQVSLYFILFMPGDAFGFTAIHDKADILRTY
ncbi:putative inorganic phosphate cotransporter [Artemia franciscana]